jgi:hypothetical protein
MAIVLSKIGKATAATGMPIAFVCGINDMAWIARNPARKK